jgi:RNA polymerase sigma-70 factor (ECF subfamily)
VARNGQHGVALAGAQPSSRHGNGANGNGDGHAAARVRELFEKHAALVQGVCRRLLRHREEAEDAAQQTFLHAYQSLLRSQPPRHAAAWLATIARNECLLRLRRSSSEKRTIDPEFEVVDPGVPASRHAVLWEAIHELPVRQRQALLLNQLSGFSYSEIASEMAISEPAVESLLFRARRQLRERLGSGAFSLGGLREILTRAASPVHSIAIQGARLDALAFAGKLAAGVAVALVVAGGAVSFHPPVRHAVAVAGAGNQRPSGIQLTRLVQPRSVHRHAVTKPSPRTSGLTRPRRVSPVTAPTVASLPARKEAPATSRPARTETPAAAPHPEISPPAAEPPADAAAPVETHATPRLPTASVETGEPLRPPAPVTDVASAITGTADQAALAVTSTATVPSAPASNDVMSAANAEASTVTSTVSGVVDEAASAQSSLLP